MTDRQQAQAPPAALTRIKAKLRQHPSVARVGITLTAENRWALKIWFHDESPPPPAVLETLSEGYPLVYASSPARTSVARPAYPREGE